jgi:hypothetical protein
MFSYSGRPPGLSGVIPSAGGVPRGQPPPPRQEKAHPRGIRRHWTSGIDGLESGLLDRLFGQIPASAQLSALCGAWCTIRTCHLLRPALREHRAMTLW